MARPHIETSPQGLKLHDGVKDTFWRWDQCDVTLKFTAMIKVPGPLEPFELNSPEFPDAHEMLVEILNATACSIEDHPGMKS